MITNGNRRIATRLRPPTVAALALVALLVAGCGGDGDSGPGTSGTATASPGATSTPASASSPTPEVTSAIVPANPSPSVTPMPPQVIDYEAFLAQHDLVLGEPPVEADVTGDGEPEALLNAHIPDCGSCHARTFFVMSGEDVLFESGGEGWLAPLPDNAGFEHISPLGIPGEGACCPSWFAVEQYSWGTSQFVLEETAGLQHFLEVNDMPVTAPLEPPVQLATVVLYYELVDRQHFAQAYALLSDQLQGQNPFNAWEAGFATTDSVFVEAVSTGTSATQIEVRFEATDVSGGVSATTTFEGVWTLVEEDDNWKLDAASIQPVAP